MCQSAEACDRVALPSALAVTSNMVNSPSAPSAAGAYEPRNSIASSAICRASSDGHLCRASSDGHSQLPSEPPLGQPPPYEPPSELPPSEPPPDEPLCEPSPSEPPPYEPPIEPPPCEPPPAKVSLVALRARGAASSERVAATTRKAQARGGGFEACRQRSSRRASLIALTVARTPGLGDSRLSLRRRVVVVDGLGCLSSRGRGTAGDTPGSKSCARQGTRAPHCLARLVSAVASTNGPARARATPLAVGCHVRSVATEVGCTSLYGTSLVRRMLHHLARGVLARACKIADGAADVCTAPLAIAGSGVHAQRGSADSKRRV